MKRSQNIAEQNKKRLLIKLQDLRQIGFVFLAFISFPLSYIASPLEDYQTANQLYADSKYEEAITKYEQLIAEKNINSAVYYNLGNAYYKSNNITAAILNYERALKLEPDNEDALFNLAMANKRTIDKIERLPELFIGNTWKKLVTSKTIESWSYYAVGLIFLALAFFVIYLFMNSLMIKKTSFYAGLVFLSLSLFTFLMAAQHNTITKKIGEAIIFSPTVTIKSEPNETSEKLFTLHEGTKVTLLEENNYWSKIKLPNGNIGWLKSSALENI